MRKEITVKIKELTVTLGRTINLENYENFRIDVSETAILNDTDNENEVYKEVTKSLYDKLNQNIDFAYKKYSNK